MMTARMLAAPYLLFASCLFAQAPDLAKVVERLDQLEKENQRLKQDIDSLRKQLTELRTASTVPVQEKLDVVQQRVEEQAQTKVEAAQKFPLKLSGLVLLN